jgi:glycosyltransferase involved in cell wall biosynthesis
MLKISVVIPTYNRLETLRVVIPSLLAGDQPADAYEIVVADSQSDDGTAEYLAEVAAAAPQVRHVPGPYSGRAMARNAGVAASRSPVILFTDSDIIASADLLSRHLEHHRETLAQAVVGMEVQVDSYAEYLVKRDDPRLRDPLHGTSAKRISWLYFLTGNASVRRADFERVGGFDESFTGYGHEDLELGYRLERAGVRIRYEPRAINYHWQAIPYEEQKRKMELAGRSTVRFYRKHPHFVVQARLGMTPLSLGLHAALARLPRAVSWLEQAGERNSFARTIAYQYHYLNGVKAALDGNQ